VEDEEGQQRPLETEDLQSILAKLNSNKIQLDASNNIVSVERNGKATTHTNDLRPVKVMIVAHNKKHQERIRSFLEDEGVFAQHIHPIVQASTLKFMYEKYKPNCLILDVLTHQMFLNAGINTLDLVHQDPSSTLKHTILLTQASMPSGLMSQLLKLKETLEVPYPLTKIDLETTCLPVLKSLQGTFSAAVKLPSKG
jgi:CheY-like chemotaxis protein